jgi:hypothetical protein
VPKGESATKVERVGERRREGGKERERGWGREGREGVKEI